MRRTVSSSSSRSLSAGFHTLDGKDRCTTPSCDCGVVADRVTAVEARDLVGAVEGRRQPVGASLRHPAGADSGAIRPLLAVRGFAVPDHNSGACYARRGETRRKGFLPHVTETCDPDTPSVITDVTTTPASEQAGVPGRERGYPAGLFT